MGRFCVFDIETAALADVGAYLPPATPRANLKDPVKIEADIREKTAAQLARAALDPDLCRVVAAGWDCDGTAGSAGGSGFTASTMGGSVWGTTARTDINWANACGVTTASGSCGWHASLLCVEQ